LTHRKQDENAQRLASVVESSDDAIISKDLDGIVRSWNKGAERLFGYTAQEVIGKPITILFPPDRIDEEPCILERLRRGERVGHYETERRRKDGTLVDVSLTVSPIFSTDGRVIGASKIARDISVAKKAREHQRLLLAEIMHRVKNTLATVQAIASQTLCESPGEEQRAFMARLHALGKAHDLLITDRWDRAPLRAIVEAAIEPFQSDRFTLEGPDVGLNAKQFVAHLAGAARARNQRGQIWCAFPSGRPNPRKVESSGQRSVEVIVAGAARPAGWASQTQGFRLYPHRARFRMRPVQVCPAGPHVLIQWAPSGIRPVLAYVSDHVSSLLGEQRDNGKSRVGTRA